MRYRVEFADGSVKSLQKSSAKRYINREDFALIGATLRQIAIKAASAMDWLTRMPPADIKSIEKLECKNMARIGTSYGNGNDETREMIGRTLLIRQCDYIGYHDLEWAKRKLAEFNPPRPGTEESQGWADWAAGVK